MEQFVLGLFQEKLSKIIVGFRKEQVNANLLNGKGEITDVSLNCSVLNQAISKVIPFIAFDEIHVSKLGFHVTAWSNLRKAPIVVDIGVVKVSIQEPLHCVSREQRKRIRMVTEKELVQLLLQGLFKGRNGSYGFTDRIADNLTIEIEKVQISFQTCGKFKTHQLGPWTPPQLWMEWSHVKIVSVDQNGNEGDPEQVWAHNRNERQEFLIYKKITMETSIKVISNGEDQTSGDLVQTMPIAIETAVKRRLRDGAVLALQLDMTIPTVEIQVKPEWISLLSHLLAGIKYAFAKDRSFEEPLKKQSSSPKRIIMPLNKKIERTLSQEDDTERGEVMEDSDGNDDDNEEDDDEEADNNNNNNISSPDEGYVGDENDTIDEPKMKQGSSHGTNDEPKMKQGSSHGTNDEPNIKQGSSHGTKVPSAPYTDRPILLLPFGIIVYENITVTCSVHHLTVRGTYSDEPESGFCEFTARGLISEFIWPKAKREFGLHTQSSFSFISLRERFGKQTKHIVIGGISHNDHPPLDKPTKPRREIGIDENFPMFERRSIRDDPLELRHSFPSQAIGIKTTIDFPKGENVKVLHEIGLDEFDFILDAESWYRIIRFFSPDDDDGFNPRWHSGDWTDEITQDMLCQPGPFLLDDHIQNVKEIFLDENALISSDDFNVTARITNIETRIPAAVQDDVRSCDILVELKESTLIVSSALPRTFISGKIGNSINGDESTNKGVIDFPNDPSDIAYTLEQNEDPSLRQLGIATDRKVSTFRFKFTVLGFQTKIVPIIPFCNGLEPQQLMAPTDSTMLVCFEGEHPDPGSSSLKISLFISIQINKIHLNVDFDLLAGAMSTLLFHFDVVKDLIVTEIKRISSQAAQVATTGEENSGKIQKTLRGRRALVRRHLNQSKDAGGLGIVFCLQLAEFGVSIWRQNVPLTSPLRHWGNASWSDEDDHHITMLRLLEMSFAQLEIGIEFDFRSLRSRRIILKSCIERGSVKVCDFPAEIRNHGQKSAGDQPNQTTMVDILKFGLGALPNDLVSSYTGPVQQFALRLEEQVKSSRSWSLAADLTSPAIINLHIDAFNDSVLLLIESLLLPASSRRFTENPSPGRLFPDSSLGAFFETIFVGVVTSMSAPSEEDSKLVKRKGESETDSFVERAFRAIFNRFLPSDLRLVLLRLELSNVLLCIPADSDQDPQLKRLGLLLNKSDAIVRFVPFADDLPTDMEKVLACKEIAWSDLIKAEGTGYFQSLSSKQSLLAIMDGVNTTETEILVQPFDIGMTYEAANFSLSMNDKLMVNDIRKIENFMSEIQSLAGRCERYNTELLSLCNAMYNPPTDPNRPEAPLHNGDEIFVEDLTSGSAKTGQERNENMRKLLRRLHHELSLFENDLRKVLRAKDSEIEQLKLQLFRKEKERFAALALVSSRISGWIRMGGLHQTGQRVARKSTMWPHWAVLRKNLLLLYSGPGEPKPVDVVYLPGGKLRDLAGGSSRQDVKRGFALIENSGTTRYFIAASAKEYNLWIREIGDVLNRSNATLPETGDYLQSAAAIVDGESGHQRFSVGINESAIHPEETRDGDTDRPDQQGRMSKIGNRLAATKNKIGSAIQTASRLRGKDESDPSDSLRPTNEQPDDKRAPSYLGDELQQNGEAKDNVDNEDEASGEDPNIGSSMRRIQFGRRQQIPDRAGLSSRIGSAIQSARQNRKDSSERQQPGTLAGLRDKLRGSNMPDDAAIEPNRNSEHSADFLLGQDGNFQWTCALCTFINNSENFPIHQTACDMCGAERQLEEPPKASSNEKALEHTPDQTTNQSTDEDTEASDSLASPASESFRRGRFGGLGAAGGSKRVETQNSNRSSGRFSFMKRAQSGDEDTFFDGGSVTLKKIHTGTHAPTSGVGDTRSVPMKMFKNRWVVSIEYSGRSAPSNSSEMDSGVEKSFLVRTHKADQSSADKGIDKNCSIGDLVYLHSQVSSGVELVLPQLINDSSDENMDRTIVQVETVVAVGRILDGMLDLNVDEMIEKTQSYLAELFESFLNSVLTCPLPIDTLASISEIIGIDSATKDITSSNDYQHGGLIKTSPGLSIERSEAILSLIVACETELLRTQNSATAVDPVTLSAKTAQRDSVLSKREEEHPEKHWIHEPLLPASVTNRFQHAMHEALMNVMAERDEVHAQLISANVLHTHELEQQRRKNDRLMIGMQVSESVAKLRQPNVANLLAKLGQDGTRQRELESKLEAFETMLKDSSDEAMALLRKQLASEVSEKTSIALEVSRLKETLDLQKANSRAEIDALKEELRRTKDLASKEKRNHESIIHEAEHFKSLYESLAAKSIEGTESKP